MAREMLRGNLVARRSRHISVTRCGLKENVASLPASDHVRSISLPALSWRIDNVPGKKASVAIYHYLAVRYDGRLTVEAARRGVELYAEVVEEAKQHPGLHPNIDLLLRISQTGEAADVSIETDEPSNGRP